MEDPNIRLSEIEKYDDENISFKNYKTILSFSMGADSFAAYKLLPKSREPLIFVIGITKILPHGWSKSENQSLY